MLKLYNVNKKFKTVIADNINLSLGNFTYGLLGRNGSGKTTLLRCITKVEKIDSGKIEYIDENGNVIKDFFGHIGYLPQNFEIFKELKSAETLRFFANLKDYKITDEEIAELLKKVNLSNAKDVFVKNLSGGMKRRLGIAQAMIGYPDTILLDEPTSGLDPEERLNFKRVVLSIKKDRCVILSTHIIADIESLCDKILVLKDGNITEFESCDKLAKVAEGKVYAVKNADDTAADYYVSGTVIIEGEEYDRVISRKKINGIELSPTVEDGYICLIENLR